MNENNIARVWRLHVQAFSQETLRNEIEYRWARDPNVLNNLIQYALPPTFQPGFVGERFAKAATKILFLGYNPGEGNSESAKNSDKVLQQKLTSLAVEEISFTEYNRFLASHLLKWPIYAGKGIFVETGDNKFALIPQVCRPSIHEIALVNLFPFKTVGNRKPLNGPMRRQLWSTFALEAIRHLNPTVIVRYPEADAYVSELESLIPKPAIIRVWHPSDYNANTRRTELIKSWQPLASFLSSNPIR